MANKISYIENENGEKISPVVNIKSIYADNGKTLLDYLHPVGSIYISTTSTNPGTIFGGTWVQWGAGRVPIGINTSDSDFNTVEKTGGNKTQDVELPYHNHFVSIETERGGRHIHSIATNNQQANLDFGYDFTYDHKAAYNSGGFPNNTGAHSHTVTGYTASAGTPSPTMSILQPYIVCYMWKRTQ